MNLDGVLRIQVKNWREFQHYKDRNPQWIKLHKGLLSDYEFQRLPDASRALAPMIWLLASEYTGGLIVATIDELSFRLHRTPEEVKSALITLIQKGFLILEQSASESLAKPEQEAIPEKRREETYKPEEKSKSGFPKLENPNPNPSGPEIPLSADKTKGRKAWESIADGLKSGINRHSFETWIQPLRGLGTADGKLYIGLPTAEFRCVEQKYGEQILAAAERVGLEQVVYTWGQA